MPMYTQCCTNIILVCYLAGMLYAETSANLVTVGSGAGCGVISGKGGERQDWLRHTVNCVHYNVL